MDVDLGSDYRRRIENVREKYEDLIRRAAEEVELSPSTKTLLDEHRAALAAFDPEGLSYLLKALDGTLPWP